MKALVTITDLTRMQEHRVCVAGCLPDGTCIRPVLRVGSLMEEWLRVKGQVVVRPFAVVEFDLQKGTPHPPHTEDWIVDPIHRVNRGMLTPEQQKALLNRIIVASVEGIFGATIHYGPGWYVMAGEGQRSLGTVRARRIWEVFFNLKETGKWDYRLAFTDQTGQRYKLAVTDLAFRYFLDHLRDQKRISPDEAAQRLTTALQKSQVFLRVGLARQWEKFPDRCYLQITGVYSFPDYLSGRCFADFAPPADKLAKSSCTEEEIPF